MDVQLRTIKNKSQLQLIRELYTTAFPPEERRSDEGLAEQLNAPDCHIDLIYIGERYAGFCIWWQFETFAFLEHFAIDPKLRGKRIGERVLKKLCQTASGTLLFEIEPPQEGDALRRLNFYLRNGFYLLNKPYRQPSYHQGEDLDLKLMSSREQIPEKVLDSWIEVVKRRVYNV